VATFGGFFFSATNSYHRVWFLLAFFQHRLTDLKRTVAEHRVELRDQEVAALQRFKKIAERLDFYKRYLLFSENYDVKLAGLFIGLSRPATE